MLRDAGALADVTATLEEVGRVVLAGVPGGAFTILGRYEAAGEAGLFVARVNRPGAEPARLAPATLDRVLPAGATIRVLRVDPSLEAEGKSLRADEYQAWADRGQGELP
ncbi:MAG: hypothetical protein R3F43_29430 [bacterium]